MNRFRITRDILISLITFCTIALILASTLFWMWCPSANPDVMTLLLTLIGIGVAVVVYRFGVPRLPMKFRRCEMYVVVGIGLLFRVTSVICIHNTQVNDFAIWQELSESIRTGKGFAYTGPVGLKQEVPYSLGGRWDEKGPVVTTFRAPGWAAVLAVWYSLTGNRTIWGELLCALLSALTGLLIFLIVRKTDDGAAWRAAIFWQCYPVSIIACNLLCSEILFTLAILFAVYILGIALQCKTALRYCLMFVAGLFTGLVTLVRPATQFIPCVIVGLLAYVCPWRNRAVLILLFCAGSLLAPLGWGLRNKAVFGVFQMQPTQIGISMSLGPAVWDVKPGTNAQIDSLKSLLDSPGKTEFQRNSIGAQIGKKRLEIAFMGGRLPILFLKNLPGTWGDQSEILQWISISCREDPAGHPMSKFTYNTLLYISSAFYLGLITLALCGSLRLKSIRIFQRPELLALLIFFFITFFLSGIFRVANSRYELPFVPVICILSGIAGVRLKNLNKGISKETQQIDESLRTQ
jgi:hypothetical protein